MNRIILWIVKGILYVLGFIVYPCKEKCMKCVEDVDYCLNPYKNPNYHEI